MATQPWKIMTFGLDIIPPKTPLLPKYGPWMDQQLTDMALVDPSPGTITPDGRTLRITTPDALFENLYIPYLVEVEAAGTKFFNCRFSGIRENPAGGALLTINSDQYAQKPKVVADHCSFIPHFPSDNFHGIKGSNFVLENCDIAQVVDGVSIFGTTTGYQPLRAGYATIRNCLIHELAWPDESLMAAGNGIRITGGHDIVVEGCLFENHMLTAAVQLTQATGDVYSLKIRDNILNITGGYAILVEDAKGNPIEDLVITDNIVYKAGLQNGIVVSRRTFDEKRSVIKDNFWRSGTISRSLVVRSA